MLPSRNGDGTDVFVDMAEKFGAANGDEKNDGMLEGIVEPIVFDPIDVVICWAGADSASAKKSIMARKPLVARTVRLPVSRIVQFNPWKNEEDNVSVVSVKSVLSPFGAEPDFFFIASHAFGICNRE